VTAIVSAVLFGLALLFALFGLSLGIITAEVLMLAGLLSLALHLAGVGGGPVKVRSYSRRRPVR
jgi:positive regulator of sigma E activity